MTDSELRTALADRVAVVRDRVARACRRSGRDPASVRLVAVTKSVPAPVAAVAAEIGLRDLAENRPQELWAKAAVTAAQYHLIGHLQRNKIDRTVPRAALIHSADSVRLMTALDDFGRGRGVPVPVLLQVNCSREESKGGFRADELLTIAEKLAALRGVSIHGLMTMAAHHHDPEACRPTFTELRTLRDRLTAATGLELPHLSMGMTNDFEVAVEEGATLVRIGTALFTALGEVRGGYTHGTGA